MNVLQKQQQEIESLKSQIKEQQTELKEKEEKILSLEKLNHWYIEQLKLRQHQKFGISS